MQFANETFSRRALPILIALFLIFSILVQVANASVIYHLQMGALGDIGSVGNMGVRAEIRTQVYRVNVAEQDSFWVGSILHGGAFIQFGYVIESAGIFCNNERVVSGKSSCLGSFQTIHDSEPVWFWSYWPNGTGDEYYSGIGASGSVGVHGSWHLYSIVPRLSGGWSFLLDEERVANANFPTSYSSEPLAFVAEKGTPSPSPGRLGPVEFRNLSYLKQDGWHSVTSLRAIVNCGVSSSCMAIPYGVASEGANHIIAGTSVSKPHDGELLWDSVSSVEKSIPLNYSKVLITVVPVAVLVLALGLIILLRRKSKLIRKRALLVLSVWY